LLVVKALVSRLSLIHMPQLIATGATTARPMRAASISTAIHGSESTNIGASRCRSCALATGWPIACAPVP